MAESSCTLGSPKVVTDANVAEYLDIMADDGGDLMTKPNTVTNDELLVNSNRVMTTRMSNIVRNSDNGYLIVTMDGNRSETRPNAVRDAENLASKSNAVSNAEYVMGRPRINLTIRPNAVGDIGSGYLVANNNGYMTAADNGYMVATDNGYLAAAANGTTNNDNMETNLGERHIGVLWQSNRGGNEPTDSMQDDIYTYADSNISISGVDFTESIVDEISNSPNWRYALNRSKSIRVAAAVATLGLLSLVTSVVIISSVTPHQPSAEITSQTFSNQQQSTDAEETSAAFQVYTNRSSMVPSQAITFNGVLVNTRKNSFSKSTGIFTSPRTGLYWFHLETTYANINTSIEVIHDLMQVNGSQSVAQLRASCRDVVSGLILSRNDLRHLHQNDQLYTTSTSNSLLSASNTHITAWFGFELRHVLGTEPVVFSVANSKLAHGIIQFSNVLVSVGYCWDEVKSIFNAPMDGVYVFSFSYYAITSPRSNVDLKLMRMGNRLPTISRLRDVKVQCSRCEQCSTTVSLSAVLYLKARDQIYVERPGFIPKTFQYQESNNDSFKGFLYAPPKAHHIVWSLLGKEQIKESTESTGPYYITFSVSNLTSHMSFADENKSRLNIRVSGIYYVAIATRFCEINSDLRCVVGLYSNESMLFKTLQESRDGNDCMRQERALLLPLQQGCNLSVRVLAGTYRSSILEHFGPSWVNFFGFLVGVN